VIFRERNWFMPLIDSFENSRHIRKRTMRNKSGTPHRYMCRCMCEYSLQVCRWRFYDGIPARGVVASNRAEQLRANYPRLAAARLPLHRTAKRTRDPRSALYAPFLTSFCPGLSRSVTRKCPPARRAPLRSAARNWTRDV